MHFKREETIWSVIKDITNNVNEIRMNSYKIKQLVDLHGDTKNIYNRIRGSECQQFGLLDNTSIWS